MATTGFWPVKGRLKEVIDYANNPDKTTAKKYLDEDLYNAIRYVENDDKTDQTMFVSGINCSKHNAYNEMIAVKRHFGERGKNIAYHGYQSFVSGEVTPEEAHEIGIETARQMWGAKYQVVVTTHLNTDNIHNHFVVNSVAFTDGRKFRNGIGDRLELRKISDAICRQRQKSVIETHKFYSNKKEYWINKSGGFSHRDILRHDVDEAIANSGTFKEIEYCLKNLGYRFERDFRYAHPSVIADGWKRPIRIDSLGENYTVERIHQRCLENRSGVVFNEMKGAYSSPDRLIVEESSAALFPDTLYGYSSGGDPAHITELTYGQFKAAHAKYYHPENSYMFLYGNMNVTERLEFIDREYLSKYTRTGLRFDIPMQQPVINTDVTAEYPITEADTEENNSYIAFSAVVGDFSEREKILAFDILISALTSTNESPLKKAVLASGIASDLSAFIYDGIAQPYVFFELRNTEPDKKEQFLSLLTNELKKLVKNGIDKKLLNAEINQAEFHLREGKQGRTPVGLLYNLDIMSSWLYGGDPATYLEYEQAVANIRKGADGRYFEELIEKYLLGSKHKAVVVMTPSRTIAAEQALAETNRVEAYRKTLSDAELDSLVEKTRRLVEYQQSENTPEEIATLPALELSDVGDDITELPCETREYNGRPLLYTPAFTKKIAYVNYYFDLSSLKPEYLPYASLYATLLGEISTAKRTAADLDVEIKTMLGSFATTVKTFTKCDDTDNVTPMFCVASSIIESNLDDALTLVGEVIDESRLDKAEIAKFIPQIKNDLQTSIIWSGDAYASLRVASYCTVEGAYQERLEGITYYTFIKELCDRFDSAFDEVKAGLEAVSQLLTLDNLTIGITGEPTALDRFEKAAPLFRKGVGGERYTVTPEYHGNEAFIIPSAVNYVAKGFNFIKEGFAYDESMNVLRNILSLDWLWNEVRVRGGAYGTGFSASRAGDACFTSYRDPCVKSTAETFDKTVVYLNDFATKVPDIKKYIISTVSTYKRPICPRDLGIAAQANRFAGRNDDMRRAGKRRVMSTTAQDIEAMSAMVKRLAEKNLCAVVGNKDKIDEAGDLFILKINI